MRRRYPGWWVDGRHALPAVLSFERAARGACHVGGNSNLGLDPKDDAAKECSNSRPVLGLASRNGHPGLQPVHLFYLLGMHSPYARMTREELAEIEVGKTAISRATSIVMV